MFLQLTSSCQPDAMSQSAVVHVLSCLDEHARYCQGDIRKQESVWNGCMHGLESYCSTHDGEWPHSSSINSTDIMSLKVYFPQVWCTTRIFVACVASTGIAEWGCHNDFWAEERCTEPGHLCCGGAFVQQSKQAGGNYRQRPCSGSCHRGDAQRSLAAFC